MTRLKYLTLSACALFVIGVVGCGGDNKAGTGTGGRGGTTGAAGHGGTGGGNAGTGGGAAGTGGGNAGTGGDVTGGGGNAGTGAGGTGGATAGTGGGAAGRVARAAATRAPAAAMPDAAAPAVAMQAPVAATPAGVAPAVAMQAPAAARPAGAARRRQRRDGWRQRRQRRGGTRRRRGRRGRPRRWSRWDRRADVPGDGDLHARRHLRGHLQPAGAAPRVRLPGQRSAALYDDAMPDRRRRGHRHRRRDADLRGGYQHRRQLQHIERRGLRHHLLGDHDDEPDLPVRADRWRNARSVGVYRPHGLHALGIAVTGGKRRPCRLTSRRAAPAPDRRSGRRRARCRRTAAPARRRSRARAGDRAESTRAS